ncbi:MAG: LysM peptidoglycan-binding domain-containing protein, partial [Acidimicrobiia bacterium]
MRRTTIFRSSRAAAVAATLVVAAAVTSARDVRAQTPTQLPEVHVVQTGETLWALAERYLGDPFLWPEIYRINTSVVEDPHWIFPGEELRLQMPIGVVEVAPDSVQVEAGQIPRDPIDAEQIPVPPTPVAPAPPPTETAPTIFQNRGPSVRSLDMTAP